MTDESTPHALSKPPLVYQLLSRRLLQLLPVFCVAVIADTLHCLSIIWLNPYPFIKLYFPLIYIIPLAIIGAFVVITAIRDHNLAVLLITLVVGVGAAILAFVTTVILVYLFGASVRQSVQGPTVGTVQQSGDHVERI